MPRADELYLLSQQSYDLCDNMISSWQKNFDWLDEVLRTAKQSRGEMIIPKTPARKKRVKKIEDAENLPPPPAPLQSEQPVEYTRKSSRAAAKVAQEKNKKALIEISNISSKIRRPSTPPKVDLEPLRKEESSENDDSDCENNKENYAVISERRCDSSEKRKEIIKTDVDSERKSLEMQNESDESGIEIQDLHVLGSDIKELVQLTTETNKPATLNICKTETTSEDASLSRSAEVQTFAKPMEDVIYLKPKVDIIFPKPTEELVFSKPTRVTRTKKRIVDEAEQDIPSVRSTRSKKVKLNSETNTVNENIELTQQINTEQAPNLEVVYVKLDQIGHSSSPCRTNTKENDVKTVNIVPERITRSKVRRPHTPPKTPPKTPPRKPKDYKHVGSPRNQAWENKKQGGKDKKKIAEVHEVSVESLKIDSSPGKVVRHRWNENNNMAESSKVSKVKTSYQTPSPASSSAMKILGLKGMYSSSSLQSAYSQKRKPFLNSSPQIIGAKVIGTPTEVNRTKNILMGSSFITKVQPSKPTKEEAEEKKQEELRRKKEREEETRRKKEELLRFKMEEQKRKNEERMRRVQEARELREKKLIQAREMQERERRQKEDRVKEEKKRRMMEAKKNEEMVKQLKKQAEEEQQRLREERRLKEEHRLREEQRLIEEMKAKEEMRKIEERKKLEERKLLEKREAERLVREKLELERRAKEADRIARETRELELLRQQESERLTSQKQMNETYTSESEPLNATYSKPTTSNQKEESIQSYEMTPKVKPSSSNKDANDYGITEIRSDDSTDDETAPKKKIPSWAQGSQLRRLLYEQEHFPPALDLIFPPDVLLQMPNLLNIFTKRRSRFTKRTSSAVWNTPPCKLFAQ